MTSHLNQNQLIIPPLDPARQEQARQYARTNRYLSLGELILTASILVALIVSGLSLRFVAQFDWPAVPIAALYTAILIVVYRLLTAPLSYYQGFVLPHRYGLSTQKLGSWLGDQAKAGAPSLLLGSGMVALVYFFITRFTDTWWLWSWGAFILLSVVLSNLAPVVILPLFFKLKPLDDANLRPRLEQLAQRAGTKISGVYTIEFSGKLTVANAALMGLGNTKRIVISDTLLRQYSPAEIEVVMTHELGHHRHKDIPRLLMIQSMIWLVGFYIADLALQAAAGPWFLAGISNVAALPLLLLVLGGYSLLISPLINSYSRHLEIIADSFALRLTDNPQSFVEVMARLTDQNLADARPQRWVELLTYSHPSYHRRLAHARYYAAHRPDS